MVRSHKLLASHLSFANLNNHTKMNIEAFEPFLTANKDRIYNYVLNFVQINADAEDIVQTTFIAFYTKMVKLEKDKALAYLYRIARNKALNWQRKNRRYHLKPMESFLLMPDSSGITERPEISALRMAISKLPEKQGLAIQLKYFDNMPYKEIASVLKVSEKQVDSLLVRAKQKLRTYLVPDGEGSYTLHGTKPQSPLQRITL
jgi:RNA polymerase sigma-70 factor, ECF subfamily